MSAAVIRADARDLPLPDGCADLVVTSPPYFCLRSYVDAGQHYDGQIGSEATPAEWLAAMLECTREWVRVLKPSGSIFVNLGDKYAGGGMGGHSAGLVGTRPQGEGNAYRRVRVPVPDKSLMGLPWRYALACMDQLGLILRRDIIWSKPNGLPESVTDRCRSSHEYLFHFTVQPRYCAAVDEIREPHTWGREVNPAWRQAREDLAAGAGNKHGTGTGLMRPGHPLGKLPGSVWSIPSQPLTVPAWLGVDHFAAFPMELPRRCVLGWSPPGVCTACGEGRRPVSAGEYEPTQRTNNAGAIERNGDNHFSQSERPHGRARSLVAITGYACACPEPDAPVRPALVVDPFGGTGTTALVASVYGRTGLSFDLSADYCRLARWRTADPAERAKALQVPKPPPVPDGQDSLFGLEVT